MEKKKAICYYRVSSRRQAEKESINLQKHSLKEFAKEKSYDVIDEFADDGISGESIESRPGFQKALAAIEEGGVDVLLVYMVDRIGRFPNFKDRNSVIEILYDSQTNIDSPEDGLFPILDEKRRYNLEGELNESRLENKRRAKRISEGHKRVRLEGGFSGGRVPYGVRYKKETKTFEENPEEVATLKVIFSKVRGEWGAHRIAKFLSQDLKKYPLPKMKRVYRKDRLLSGIKRGDEKKADHWSKATVRSFVYRDFYFTGIIAPDPAVAKKGLPPVDTKIRLFSEREVTAAREEMRIRRWPTKKGGKRRHELLFRGFARCAYCDWKLGPYYAEYKNSIPRIYYRCRGKDHKKSMGCMLKNVPQRPFDTLLWNKFIKLLEDPETLEKQILKEEFIIDKDRADLETVIDKAMATLKDLEAEQRRLNRLYVKDKIKDDQYSELLKEIETERQKAEEDREKADKAWRRPTDIKHAVKRATKILADQVYVLWCLEQMEEIKQKASGLVESADADRANAGESEEEQLQALYLQLRTSEIYNEALDGMLKVIEDLNKNREGPTVDDLKNKDIRQLIYQQKRLMLQQFIDPERGIEVWNKDKFEIHLSIPKEIGDPELSKQNKSLKHPSRPALPPARV